VQVGITNDRSDPDRVTVSVSDPSGSQAFAGQAVIDFDDGEDSAVWVQFSNFPLQADQVTPTGECNYSISVQNRESSSGTQVSYDLRTF
jgi:hypothetical protein